MFTYKIGEQIAKKFDDALKIAVKTLTESDLNKMKIEIYHFGKSVASFEILREGKSILFDDYFLRSNLNSILAVVVDKADKRKSKKTEPKSTPMTPIQTPVIFERVISM